MPGVMSIFSMLTQWKEGEDYHHASYFYTHIGGIKKDCLSLVTEILNCWNLMKYWSLQLWLRLRHRYTCAIEKEVLKHPLKKTNKTKQNPETDKVENFFKNNHHKIAQLFSTAVFKNYMGLLCIRQVRSLYLRTKN